MEGKVMKKLLAVLLAALMILSVAACGAKPNTNTAESEVQEGPTTQEESTAQEESEVQESTEAEELTGMLRVIMLNNAFEGLETSKQCYNAKEYHKCYNLGEMIDDNFWFVPAEDTEVQTVAYTDFYSDVCDLETFRGKFISFQEDNDEFDYDLFVGPNQKESNDVQYKGYLIVDKEAFLLMQEEGWNVKELFEYIAMADADSYDFVCADGYTETIAKEDLENVAIFYSENGTVDATSIAYPDSSLMNIQYIIPTGLTKESEPAAEGISRITIARNAVGVYETEAPYSENRAGTFYDAWAVTDLFEKFDVKESEKVQCVSSLDSYTQDEDFSLFTQKYIAYQGPNEKGDNKDFFTLGRAQERNTGVTNVGYYVLDEDAFAYIPADGIAVSDIFSAIGMCEAPDYVLTYADGTTETKAAAEVTDMTLEEDSNLVSIVASN